VGGAGGVRGRVGGSLYHTPVHCGENARDDISCSPLSAKEPLIMWLFCEK